MLYETLPSAADFVFTERRFICNHNKPGDMIKKIKRIGWQENEIASKCVRVTKKLSHLLTNKNQQS